MKVLLAIRVSVLAAALTFLAHHAQGQIVNIEKKRLGKFEEGWFGNVDLGLNLTRNTRTIWQIQNRANVQRNWKKTSLMVLGDVKLVMVENERFLNSGFGHIRFNRPLNESRKVTLEAFTQYSYNKPQRIDARLLYGAGTRFNLVSTDSLEIFLGTLVMGEDEQITDSEIVNRDIRASTYLSLEAYLGKSIKLNTITYYQPRLDEFADYRLSNESSLVFSFSKRFELRVIWNMVYDTRPPEGVPDLNYKLSNSLRFTFG